MYGKSEYWLISFVSSSLPLHTPWKTGSVLASAIEENDKILFCDVGHNPIDMIDQKRIADKLVGVNYRCANLHILTDSLFVHTLNLLKFEWFRLRMRI